MFSEAPLAWRATPGCVYMVGTAATPVGNDRVDIDIRVRAGSRLSVRSTAATIVWSGSGSQCRLSIDVEDGACLDWQPEPLVATAGCDHQQHAWLRLAPGATVRWRELLVAGRVGEPAGPLRSHLSVDQGGRALLRHALVTGPESAWVSPAVMASHRVAGTLLVVDTSGSPSGGAGDGWALMSLHCGGSLIVAVGADVPTVSARLSAAESVS